MRTCGFMVFVLLAALPARAHAPGRLHDGEVFVLQKPDLSYAVFGEFTTGEERFVLTVNHPVRFGTPLELRVPHQQTLRDHRPAWAVVVGYMEALKDWAFYAY